MNVDYVIVMRILGKRLWTDLLKMASGVAQ